MKKSSYILLFPLLSFLLGGCSKDNYTYPSVITELADLHTDSNGKISLLINDNNQEWQLVTSIQETYPADTVFRTLSMYEPLETTDKNNKARLYSSKTIFSSSPIPLKDMGMSLKRDAVDIERIWLTPNYLNMVLWVQVKDHAHQYNFVFEECSVNADNSRTFTFSLHHDRKGDSEAFTEQVYMSLPLKAYQDSLQKGDRIIFRLNTYAEGYTNRTFIY